MSSTQKIDLKSKQKACSLWDSKLYHNVEIGTINGLQKIHKFIFDGLYDFAGQIRTKNISKNGFLFSLCQHFVGVLPNIDKMPQKNFWANNRKIYLHEYSSSIYGG